MASKLLQKKLSEEFKRDQVLTAKEELACYSYDSGIYTLFHYFEPDAAVLAKSVNDVIKTLAIARELKVPVVPRGAGTGQAGGALAPTGGICLDLSGWKDIEQVMPEDYQAFVRPGVTLDELNKAFAPYGLYLPPDPSSGSACTIGGMAANNTAGQRSLKYGAMDRFVMGLEVVLPTGEVVTLGGKQARVIKSVSGLDMKTGLFVGSEGILGVITGIRVKMAPVPPARAGILFLSADKKSVPALIREVYKAGVVFSACEFVLVQPSAEGTVAKNLSDLRLPSPLEMVLLMEFEGNLPGVAWELNRAKEIAASFAGTSTVAESREQMQRLWFLLDEAEGGVMGSRPGTKRTPGGEDIVVPPSRLIEALDGIQQLVGKAGVACVNFGHAVFGNIHTGLLIKPDDAEEMKKVETLIDGIHALALALNGSTTGEHGTGIVRSPLLTQEHGQAAEMMRRVKNLFDPDNIMNPGKILPADRR
ncbi:MAG: FAD-binding oxidoreductase [Deltaproteobacteria bacterium]|nr:FAD-binding oxidoreductase [Deltaproteobacteria bacterium]